MTITDSEFSSYKNLDNNLQNKTVNKFQESSEKNSVRGRKIQTNMTSSKLIELFQQKIIKDSEKIPLMDKEGIVILQTSENNDLLMRVEDLAEFLEVEPEKLDQVLEKAPLELIVANLNITSIIGSLPPAPSTVKNKKIWEEELVKIGATVKTALGSWTALQAQNKGSDYFSKKRFWFLPRSLWRTKDGEIHVITKEVLGKGSFSKTKLMVGLTSHTAYAIGKPIKNDEKYLKSIKKEKKLLKKLSAGFKKDDFFPFVLANDIETSDKIRKKMELGTDLSSKIRDLTPLEKHKIAGDLLYAVMILEHNEIIHRDIKLENILLVTHKGESRAKIADFGLSQTYEDIRKHSNLRGTPDNISRSLLVAQKNRNIAEKKIQEGIRLISEGKEAEGKSKVNEGETEKEIANKVLVSNHQDIYALGMSLLVLWSGFNPILEYVIGVEDDDTLQELLQKIVDTDQTKIDDLFSQVQLPFYEAMFSSIIRDAVSENPPTAKDLYERFLKLPLP